MGRDVPRPGPRRSSPIATCAAATAQQIAWWSTGRRAIALDPKWRNGHYYDAAPGDGPHAGLALARMISQITFRTDDVFTDRFGREVVEPLAGRFSMWQRFEVERYLEYHGDKLVRRFDANSYLLLTKAMDLHDVGRGRGGIGGGAAPDRGAHARRSASPPTSCTPPYQQRELCRRRRTRPAATPTYVELDSPHGHDAFLIEHDQLSDPIRPSSSPASRRAPHLMTDPNEPDRAHRARRRHRRAGAPLHAHTRAIRQGGAATAPRSRRCSGPPRRS